MPTKNNNTDTCFCHDRAVIRGLCQTHYLSQVITPLQKERDNSQDIVDRLNIQIADGLRELELARRADIKAKTPKAEAATTQLSIYCTKCSRPWPLNQARQLIDHERDCRGPVKPKQAKPKQRTRSLATSVARSGRVSSPKLYADDELDEHDIG